MSKQSSYVDDQINNESLRIEEINQSILFSGDLHMRHLYSDNIDVKNMMVFKDSFWSKRFAVIRTGLLLLYENRTDVYDEDRDPVDEIGLANILVIESSTDDLLDFNLTHELEGDDRRPPVAPCLECLFDVHARVQFGGDSQGIRVFSFYSDSMNSAVNWMSNLCHAVGFLELVPAAGGGFVSVVSEAAIIERKEQQLKRQVAMMREGTGGDSLRRLASCSQLSDARGMPALSLMGRGRGRGRAFRGLTNTAGKRLGDYTSPDKDGTLTRGFHSEPDALEYLAYNRSAGDGPDKKEKYMADVHRNHFKDVALAGTATGRGRGKGRGRGPTRTHSEYTIESAQAALEDDRDRDTSPESAYQQSIRQLQDSSPEFSPSELRPSISPRAQQGRGRGRGRAHIESHSPF